MSRKPVRRVSPSPGKTPVQSLGMEHFGRQLAKFLREKGWSYSDLAREVWGEIDTPTGKAARNRDRISVYVRGKQYPDPKNLELIAKALGVEADELAPDLAADTIERESPEISMVAVAGHHDKCFLRINKLVPIALAAHIIALLADKSDAELAALRNKLVHQQAEEMDLEYGPSPSGLAHFGQARTTPRKTRDE